MAIDALMPKWCLNYCDKRIKSLLTKHYKETFARWLDTERIVCKLSFHLPKAIHPTTNTNAIGGSLYQAEEDMNPWEAKSFFDKTATQDLSMQTMTISYHLKFYTPQ